MKKLILTIFIAFLILTLTSCDTIEKPSTEPTEVTEEKPIQYKIEKIILSKGYQSLEPNVEILKKNGKTKILMSLGLVESSGIHIDKITRDNNEINIYTNKLSDKDKIQLAIPQAIVELEISNKENLDNIKFNIINQNYQPIELKFSKSQILNKIYSQFKMAPNTTPEVELIKTDESFVWNIDFNNIFDRDDLKAPLINFHIKADANTGKIIDSSRNIISDYIDEGLILDYIPEQYLLYKQEQTNDENSTDMLWLYNIKNKQKEKIYETKDSIYTANFSPDRENISLIENDTKNKKNISDIYLININNKTANKITPIDHNNTWNMKWKDENNLYFINNNSEDNSTLFKYNIEEKSPEKIFSVEKNISEFDFKDDLILFTEFNEKELNKNIYITKDGNNLVEIDKGYKINFLDDNSIIYLKNLHDENKDMLCLYKLNDNSTLTKPEFDVKNYIKLNSNSLLIIVKNSCNNDYNLIKYNVSDKTTIEIAEITGEKLFYDENLNKGYISLAPPVENDKKHIIYSINLNKFK